MVDKSYYSDPENQIIRPNLLADLSSRETEVAKLYAQGQTSKEIANLLCISQTTVRNHVARIYQKLGVGNKS